MMLGFISYFSSLFSFSSFLAYIAGIFCGARALHNPSFAGYGRHLRYENAQRARVSQKGPQSRG